MLGKLVNERNLPASTKSNTTPLEDNISKDQEIELYYEPAEDICNDIIINDPKTILQEELNKM